MADNHVRFSFTIDSWSDQQHEAFIKLVDAYDDWVNGRGVSPDIGRDLAERGVGRDESTLGIQFEREGSEITIFAEEWGHPDSLVALLQLVLKWTDDPRKLGFSYVGTATLPRPGEFWGGAVVFDRHDAQWLTTINWLAERGIE